MILVNGQNEACIDPLDRGIHYGDGLFETMALIDGRIAFLEKHYQRLVTGCKTLGLTPPSLQVLQADIEKLNVQADRAVVKLILTRGVGGRGYAFPLQQHETRLLFSYPWPDYPIEYRREGLAVKSCETRAGDHLQLAGIKHLNRLEQVLARNECDRDGFSEGLMFNRYDELVEAVSANVFLVFDKNLVTPLLLHGGIKGIMRGQVLKVAEQLGFSVEEKVVEKKLLQRADGLFLTNSLIGIWPIKKLDSTDFAIPPLVFGLQESIDQTRGFN